MTVASVAVIVIGIFSLATLYTTVEMAAPRGFRIAAGRDVGFPFYCDLLIAPEGYMPSTLELFLRSTPHVPLELAEYEELLSQVEALPEVEIAVPHIGSFPVTSWRIIKANGTIIHPSKEESLSVQGIDPVKERQLRELGNSMIMGRYLETDDYDSVIIGYSLAKKHNLEVGDVLRLKGYEFSEYLNVVGIFMTGDMDEYQRAYITMKMAKDMFDAGDKVSDIGVLIRRGNLLTAAQKLAEITTNEIYFPTYESVSELGAMPILSNVRATYLAHSPILILLTVLGCLFVFQAMITNIYDRIREIGVMKAVGWRESNVFQTISTEAFIIGIVGGGVGYLGGSLIPVLLERFGLGHVLLLETSWFDAIGCLVLATVICLLAALIPAYIAATAAPVEAMART